MNILFICKYNKFRSKSAEALFNKYNRSDKINVKSAGMIIDIMNPYVPKSVIDELSQRGAKVSDEKSQVVNEKLIKWADKIVVVADDVSLNIFPKEKIEQWSVKDASNEFDNDGIKKSVDNIEKKVKEIIIKLTTQMF